MRKRGLTEKGKAWAGVTVDDRDILEMAGKLAKGLTWSGPLEVEVMKAHDGKIYLIEINPRFPAWIYLSHAAGRNLPIALLRTLAGETDLQLPDAKCGTFFIRYAEEIIVELAEFETMMITGGIASVKPLLNAS
jgi:carbamoyl-phosphate synthase large subunit